MQTCTATGGGGAGSVPAAWLDELCLASTRLLAGGFRTQALANMAWGLAALRHVPPPAWTVALMRASGQRLGDCTHQVRRRESCWRAALGCSSEADSARDIGNAPTPACSR